METKKDDLIRIRISKDDKQKLQEEAKKLRMTLSQYILYKIYSK